MIRTILCLLCVILFFIIGLPVQLVLWLIGKRNPALRDRLSFQYVKLGFRGVTWLAGPRITVEGLENLLPGTPVLYVGNHRSYCDVIFGYRYFPDPTGYVAKKEFEKIPFLSLWMRNIHCLFLDRENIRESMKTILEGIALLKNGISLCVYPEGTRAREGDELDMLPFKEGAMKLAEKSGVPVIPVAATGMADAFERQFPAFRRTDVRIRFGKPIYLKELPPEQRKFSGAYVQSVILDMLRDMKQA